MACGITGYGEIYSASFSPHLKAQMAENMFFRYLKGTDPHQIELFMRRAHGSGFSHWPDPTVWGKASGLKIAMMDILGKAHDMPFYELLGGRVQSRLRTYTYLYPEDNQDATSFYGDPILSAECAARMIAELDAIRHMMVAPHLYCDPIVAAATMQFATAISNFLILEAIQKMGGFHNLLLIKLLLWEDGFIIVSDSPGLGVELNENVARSHPYKGHQLLLQMGRYPYNPCTEQGFAGG